ncbi:hypothetical protein GJ496_007162 [Pomphorhynchus laevis]|nr:hypothetical protein GJ496_007162 [Pomphorhynchus laevis]
MSTVLIAVRDALNSMIGIVISLNDMFDVIGCIEAIEDIVLSSALIELSVYNKPAGKRVRFSTVDTVFYFEPSTPKRFRKSSSPRSNSKYQSGVVRRQLRRSIRISHALEKLHRTMYCRS